MSGNPSGAPTPLNLNGVDYLMSPLTDEDTDELNNFLKQRVLTTARSFCEGEKNKDIIDATMKAAMDKAVNVDWMSNPELLENVPGMVYLLWIGVRKNDPKPSRAEFKKALEQDWEVNLDRAMDALKLVNPFLSRQSRRNVPTKNEESQDQK